MAFSITPEPFDTNALTIKRFFGGNNDGPYIRILETFEIINDNNQSVDTGFETIVPNNGTLYSYDELRGMLEGGELDHDAESVTVFGQPDECGISENNTYYPMGIMSKHLFNLAWDQVNNPCS